MDRDKSAKAGVAVDNRGWANWPQFCGRRITSVKLDCGEALLVAANVYYREPAIAYRHQQLENVQRNLICIHCFRNAVINDAGMVGTPHTEALLAAVLPLKMVTQVTVTPGNKPAVRYFTHLTVTQFQESSITIVPSH